MIQLRVLKKTTFCKFALKFQIRSTESKKPKSLFSLREKVIARKKVYHNESGMYDVKTAKSGKKEVNESRSLEERGSKSELSNTTSDADTKELYKRKTVESQPGRLARFELKHDL